MTTISDAYLSTTPNVVGILPENPEEKCEAESALRTPRKLAKDILLENLAHLHITPETLKGCAQSIVHLSEDKEPSLTSSEFTTLVKYHNKHYDYKLNPTICDDLLDCKAEVRDFLNSSGEKNEGERHSWIFKFDGEHHHTMVHGEILDGKHYFFVLDSIGEPGKYIGEIVQQLNTIREMKSKGQILVIGPQRQQDDYSCGLFALNDLRFMSKNTDGLRDILHFGGITRSDRLPNCGVVTLPPIGLLTGLQSMQSLEKLKKLLNSTEANERQREEITQLEDIIDQYSRNISYLSKESSDYIFKKRNFFINEEWKCVRKILGQESELARIDRASRQLFLETEELEDKPKYLPLTPHNFDVFNFLEN
ncbi:MAG: hypothetical protein ACI9S8_001041 [Chlamydiales bacterium]|jgi:hypothetical protein